MSPLRTALVALLLSATALPAQRAELASIATSPDVTTRALVRVRSGPLQLTGRVVAFAGDTILLRASMLPFRHRVPVTLTTPLLISTGPASRGRGALIGAGAGVLAGLFVGLVIVDAFDGNAKDAAELSTYFLPYTIPAGALAGALFPGHRWVRVTLAPR
jgi:hypothetical protein